MSDKKIEFKVGLHIEDEPDISASVVSIGTDPETGVTHVLGTNFEASSVGARAVAELLAQCSEAIYAELVRSGEHGRNVSEAEYRKRPPRAIPHDNASPYMTPPDQRPARPRFNPQPRGGKG